jgi:hypothetical protein
MSMLALSYPVFRVFATSKDQPETGDICAFGPIDHTDQSADCL